MLYLYTVCVFCVWRVCGVRGVCGVCGVCVVVWCVQCVCVHLCVNNNDIPIVCIILSIGLYKKNNDIPIFEPAAAGSV